MPSKGEIATPVTVETVSASAPPGVLPEDFAVEPGDAA
jgi:hypothetical protein